MNDFSNLIHQVTEKADIVNIIGHYIKLEKKGAGYFGLCPFHDDKNPSLSVSPDKKIYKCFSCNASGNAIKFVENFKNISFMDALREVASTVNIPIKVSKTEIEDKKNEKYYQVMKASQDFFTFYLKNTLEGQDALNYLSKRKLDSDLINRFNIGLAPSEANLLYQSLTKKSFLAIDLAEVGLVRLAEDYYDVFRKRIIFPITDLMGRTVGYSGRKYHEDNHEAKYINTNETIIFKKGQILYNYYEALNAIKKANSVIIFEGFMDVIASYKAGVENAVATMGTSLTNEQIKALKRLTNNVNLCYDGDTAGIEATIRAIKMLVKEGLNIQVVSMPSGLDPDDYLNKYGSSELNKRLRTNLVSGAEFIYNQALNKYQPNDLNSIEVFKEEVFTLLNSFTSATVHEIYLNKMSALIGISKEALLNDFNKATAQAKAQGQVINEPFIPFVETKPKPLKRINLTTKYLQIQKDLIFLAFHHQDKFLEIDHNFDSHYVIEEFREIMDLGTNKIINDKGLDIKAFADLLSPEAKITYEKIIFSPIKPDITKLQMYLDEFVKWPFNKTIEMSSDDPENIIKVLGCKKQVVNIKKRRE